MTNELKDDNYVNMQVPPTNSHTIKKMQNKTTILKKHKLSANSED